MGDFKIKTQRVKIYLWTKGVGHIAIAIGFRYTSFQDDRSDPAKAERLLDKNGMPYTRTKVPGFNEDARLPVIKYPGKLSKNFNEDKNRYGDTSQVADCSIAYRDLSENEKNKPVRSTYQLVDTVAGNDTHNNCVNYVRQEIFLYLNDDELKRKLLKIHKPLDFFLAIKTLNVLQRMDGTNIVFS